MLTKLIKEDLLNSNSAVLKEKLRNLIGFKVKNISEIMRNDGNYLEIEVDRFIDKNIVVQKCISSIMSLSSNVKNVEFLGTRKPFTSIYSDLYTEYNFKVIL